MSQARLEVQVQLVQLEGQVVLELPGPQEVQVDKVPLDTRAELAEQEQLELLVAQEHLVQRVLQGVQEELVLLDQVVPPEVKDLQEQPEILGHKEDLELQEVLEQLVLRELLEVLVVWVPQDLQEVLVYPELLDQVALRVDRDQLA